MSKKPILVLTGLAVAAVAAVAGLTRDQWMAPPPQTVAGTDAATAPAEQASNTEPAPVPEQPAATAETAAETPATAAETSQQAGAPATSAEPAPAAATESQSQTAAKEVAATPPEPAPDVQDTVGPPAATVESAAQPEAPPAEPAAQPEPVPQQTAAAQPGQTAPSTEPAVPAKTAVAPQPDAPKPETPAFDTVRVEKSGEAVIAGTAEAGSEVVVKLDGQEIGKATANADGAFVVVPDVPLPKGSGQLTIESKGKGDLQPTASEQSVAVIVPAEANAEALVAVVSPNAPTKVLQKPQAEAGAEPRTPAPEAQPETKVAAAQPEVNAPPAEPAQQVAPKAVPSPAKAVSIDAVDYDTAGNIMFSGQGEPGQTARIYIDNNYAGDATVGADGRWSHSGSASMAPGLHKLRVDGVDASGKVANRVEVPFYREEQSKVAAAVPPAEQPADQTAAKTEPAIPPSQLEQQVAAAGPEDAATVPAQPVEGRVVIQPGNNLWRISRVLYGSGEKYTLLYKANKDQIRDPDLIYPGQIFKTPEVAAKIETIDPKRRDPLKPEEGAGAQ